MPINPHLTKHRVLLLKQLLPPSNTLSHVSFCTKIPSVSRVAEVEQEELFAEVLHEKLRFPNKWMLWEHYDTDNYNKSMRKVAWFDDVLSFAEAWKNLPHSSVSNFFYDDDKKTINMHKIDNEEKRVNGFSLFELNIHPSWEDPINE